MKALLLKETKHLEIADIDIKSQLDPMMSGLNQYGGDCGSDVPLLSARQNRAFYRQRPMVLGHEASGTVIETGPNVKNFKVGTAFVRSRAFPT